MASPNIAFDTIPASMRKPGQYLEWNNKLAVQNLPTNRQRVLLIGQRLASAMDTGKLFDVYSDVDVAASCGYGSIAHLMAKSAITAYPYAALSMITVADNSEGHAATGKITLSGTATKSGRISVRINNFDTINVLIASADDASAIATALQNAINAETGLPVTAAVNADTVTLTAKNKGLVGNDIKLSTTVTVTGITSTVTAMTDGDLNPSIKAVLAAVAGEGHNIIVCPFNDEDSCLDLRAHLETVADPREKRWAVGVIGHTGTLAQAVTLTTSLNHEFICMPWYKGSPSLPYELAAAGGGVIASEEDPARPEQFHNNLSINRRTRLENDKLKLLEESRLFKTERQELINEKNKRISALQGKRALDEYIAIAQNVAMLEEEKARLYKFINFKNELQERLQKIQEIQVEENRYANEYVLSNPLLKFDQIFSELAEVIYPRTPAGIVLENNTGDNQLRYNLIVQIEGDNSDGINSAKVICFDWMLLMYGANHLMNMLFHDNRLFADIDPKGRAAWFSHVNSQLKMSKKQYIATINTENYKAMLPYLDEQTVSEIEKSVILTLRGDKTENKLLGIRFDKAI